MKKKTQRLSSDWIALIVILGVLVVAIVASMVLADRVAISGTIVGGISNGEDTGDGTQGEPTKEGQPTTIPDVSPAGQKNQTVLRFSLILIAIILAFIVVLTIISVIIALLLRFILARRARAGESIPPVDPNLPPQ